MNINPMQAAPRCTAKSKRTGQRCRAPAVKGWKVCRMHGARGGAPEGAQNGNYKHGVGTREMIVLHKLIKSRRGGSAGKKFVVLRSLESGGDTQRPPADIPD